MTRRTKIIIAGFILALIALALWFWLSYRPASAPTTNAPATNSPAAVTNGALPSGGSTTTNVAVNATPTPPAVAPDPALAVKQLAMTFAERYGSFSSLGSFENQLDMLPLMSASYAAQTQAYVKAQLAKPPQTVYHGFTTRALSVTVDALDDTQGTAVLTVKTQRQEFTDPAGKGTVTYRDIRIGFVKEGGAWKVDSAAWQ